MPKNNKITRNSFNGPVVTGLLATVLGVGLLLLSNYMLTGFTFSPAQTHRADAVDYVGRVISIIGIIILTVCLVKKVYKDYIKNR
jgi:hypothetical protein